MRLANNQAVLATIIGSIVTVGEQMIKRGKPRVFEKDEPMALTGCTIDGVAYGLRCPRQIIPCNGEERGKGGGSSTDRGKADAPGSWSPLVCCRPSRSFLGLGRSSCGFTLAFLLSWRLHRSVTSCLGRVQTGLRPCKDKLDFCNDAAPSLFMGRSGHPSLFLRYYSFFRQNTSGSL